MLKIGRYSKWARVLRNLLALIWFIWGLTATTYLLQDLYSSASIVAYFCLILLTIAFPALGTVMTVVLADHIVGTIQKTEDESEDRFSIFVVSLMFVTVMIFVIMMLGGVLDEMILLLTH